MHRGANPAVPVRQPRTEANSDGIAKYLRYKCRQPNSCRHFLICPSCCQPSSSSLRWRYCPTPKDHPLYYKTDIANHAGRCGRDFSEDIPHNGKRTAQSITNLRTNRELVSASTTPLPLPRQASPSLLDKKRRFRGNRFPRPASFVNLRTHYSPYFKLMGNNTPTNQQKRQPRRRHPPKTVLFVQGSMIWLSAALLTARN